MIYLLQIKRKQLFKILQTKNAVLEQRFSILL